MSRRILINESQFKNFMRIKLNEGVGKGSTPLIEKLNNVIKFTSGYCKVNNVPFWGKEAVKYIRQLQGIGQELKNTVVKSAEYNRLVNDRNTVIGEFIGDTHAFDNQDAQKFAYYSVIGGTTFPTYKEYNYSEMQHEWKQQCGNINIGRKKEDKIGQNIKKQVNDLEENLNILKQSKSNFVQNVLGMNVEDFYKNLDGTDSLEDALGKYIRSNNVYKFLFEKFNEIAKICYNNTFLYDGLGVYTFRRKSSRQNQKHDNDVLGDAITRVNQGCQSIIGRPDFIERQRPKASINNGIEFVYYACKPIELPKILKQQ